MRVTIGIVNSRDRLGCFLTRAEQAIEVLDKVLDLQISPMRRAVVMHRT